MESNEQLQAEDNIEQSLSYFRNTEHGATSLYKRNHHRKVIIREMAFLRQNFPESYILCMDIADVSLKLE